MGALDLEIQELENLYLYNINRYHEFTLNAIAGLEDSKMKDEFLEKAVKVINLPPEERVIAIEKIATALNTRMEVNRIKEDVSTILERYIFEFDIEAVREEITITLNNYLSEVCHPDAPIFKAYHNTIKTTDISGKSGLYLRTFLLGKEGKDSALIIDSHVEFGIPSK